MSLKSGLFVDFELQGVFEVLFGQLADQELQHLAFAFADLAEFDSESYLRFRMLDLALQRQILIIHMERHFQLGAGRHHLLGQDQASNL